MAKKRSEPAKPRRTPKTKSSAPGAESVQGQAGGTPGKGHNRTELTQDEQRALFLQHRTSWNGWQAKVKALEAIERDIKAALKGDGFTVKQFQIADSLSSVKGELKITTEVRERLQVARWLGHSMGAQLDLFQQPDRTPSTDAAFDQGKMASMQNEARRPPYAPETEQYRSWMAGYQQHQEQVLGQFKRREPNGGDGEDDAVKASRAADDEEFDKAAPTTKEPAASTAEHSAGEYISRAGLKRRLAAASGAEVEAGAKPH